MTFYRVWSQARWEEVRLENLFDGATAFLVGGSPALLQLNLRLFKMPGVWSMAINNAAMVFEPDAFICLDSAEHFYEGIFTNTRILKLINCVRTHDLVQGKKLCRYPNTLFYSNTEEGRHFSNFCSPRGPLVYWQNTFFTALHCLYQMGFVKVYLVGCTFDSERYKDSYAHGLDNLPQELADRNKLLHDDSVESMKLLVPRMEDEGFIVKTCHSDTPLEGICDYVPFEEAIGEVATAATAVEANKLVHPRRDELKKIEEFVEEISDSPEQSAV